MAKTHEQFIQDVLNTVGEDYTVLNKYIKSSIKVRVRHKCEHEYDVLPSNILSGYGCPSCAGKTKKTTEQFKEDLFRVSGESFAVLSEYTSALKKIMVRHECGHEYEAFPGALLRGSTCRKCSGTFKKTTDVFKKEVYDQVGDEYSVVSEYLSAKKYIFMKHNKCGNTYPVTPAQFINNKARCRKCVILEKALNRTKSHEQFVKEVYDLMGNRYEVIGQYKTTRIKVRMKHVECGHEFNVRPSDVLNSMTGCPKCNLSKGEQVISLLLNNNNVIYETEYKFDDCKNVRRLPFDFAIKDKDKVVCLIEYQGEQHYKPASYFDGNRKFEKQQKNDLIKRTYCKDNGLKLIEIPYWDFDNIKNILINKKIINEKRIHICR